MIRAALALPAVATGVVIVGAGIGACLLFRGPIHRKAKSAARQAVARSVRAQALLDTIGEDLDDIRAEAEYLRAGLAR